MSDLTAKQSREAHSALTNLLWDGDTFSAGAEGARSYAHRILAALPAPEPWVPDVVRDATDPPTDSEGNPATLVATYVGLAVTDQPYLGQAVEDVLAAADRLFAENGGGITPFTPEWVVVMADLQAAIRRYRASTYEPKP